MKKQRSGEKKRELSGQASASVFPDQPLQHGLRRSLQHRRVKSEEESTRMLRQSKDTDPCQWNVTGMSLEAWDQKCIRSQRYCSSATLTSLPPKHSIVWRSSQIPIHFPIHAHICRWSALILCYRFKISFISTIHKACINILVILISALSSTQDTSASPDYRRVPAASGPTRRGLKGQPFAPDRI
jgi:hypothetical protein